MDYLYDWRFLKDLSACLGPSFYIFSPESYVDNFHSLLSEFTAIYENTSIAHSYKTNYLPRLCQLADSLGVYAEVVSPMEYEMARRFGVDGARIIFNGPIKHRGDLERALEDGAIVNIDSPGEAGCVMNYCRNSRETHVTVGIRVAFDIGSSIPSRFGLCVESGEAARVCSELQELANCRVVGLHCHFSGAREAVFFRKRSEMLLALADRIFESPPMYLDIGGGLCGPLKPEMKAQFPYDVPTFRDYAAAAAKPFAARYGRRTDAPALIIEPGMGLMANVLQFVARVEVIKERQGRRIAVCSGSIYNTQPLSRRIALPLAVVGPQGVSTDHSDVASSIAGCTCMEIDIMHDACSSDVAEGDFLVFENVGAYTTVLTPPFIQTAPPVIELTPDGEPKLLRRAQTVDDILRGYIVDVSQSP